MLLLKFLLNNKKEHAQIDIACVCVHVVHIQEREKKKDTVFDCVSSDMMIVHYEISFSIKHTVGNEIVCG